MHNNTNCTDIETIWGGGCNMHFYRFHIYYLLERLVLWSRTSDRVADCLWSRLRLRPFCFLWAYVIRLHRDMITACPRSLLTFSFVVDRGSRRRRKDGWI